MTAGSALSRVLAAYRSPAALCNCPADTSMLLGLSGGADSRLLLHLTAEECKKSGAALQLAHIHHGIRGREADRDEQFCRELADEYGLTLHVLHADIPAMAQACGESIETVARRVRYDYFAQIMEQHSLSLLLTAHNADDNLETVLLRLARGCGLSGLGGIAPVRDFDLCPKAKLIRPLLGCSKADIIEACSALGLDYMTDSTNADTAYARNLVRARILPALSVLADHPEQQVLRMCETLREDEELLCSIAIQFLPDNERRKKPLSRAAFAQCHPAIVKRALRLWIHDEGGYWPEACHVEAILRLCKSDRTAGQVHLPGGLVARVERDELQLLHEHTARVPAEHRSFTFPFALGPSDHPDLGFRLSVNVIAPGQHQTITQNDKNVYNPFIRDTLIFDTIVECTSWCEGHALQWRNRREGDTLLMHGVNRKLRKLQNEVGLPAMLRDRLPLLCEGDTVLWAPFVGARDGFFAPITEKSSHALRLTVEILPPAATHTKEDYHDRSETRH